MDQPTSLDSNSATTASSYASNKRKYNNNMGGERVAVAVKIEGNGKKQRSEGSLSDCWSWRKYGQKPIKGSSYPRGYYRCSTSKNCSAKKQVERCKTDATTLIITYTCAHNHPEPDSRKQEPEGTPKQEPESKHEQETPVYKDHNNTYNNIDQGDHPKFTFNSLEDHLVEENPYNEDLQLSSLPLDFSEFKTEENDFYDELEELPTSSFFTAFMRSDFCDRRILLNPF
ncbi:uncharacterized protein LOC142504570 [Primulina tabacum]|uniref:uncharacterized protein LOC142504570 n=1 Tax=Primulina tabacum TaxID=48773 RepID=UPI003F599E08